MSLRGKVTLVLTGITVLATLLVALLALQATRTQLLAGVDQSLTRVSNQPVWARLAAVPEARLAELEDLGGALRLPRELRNELLRVQVTSADGTVVLVGDETLDVDADVLAQASDGVTVFFDVEEEGQSYRAMASPFLGSGDILIVAQGVTDEQTVLRRLAVGFLLIGLVVAGIAALLGWFASAALVRPLERLTDAAEGIAESGDLDVDVRTEAADEAGRLSRAFDNMLDALSESRRQQRQLVADAGHELRTPIASILSNAEVLRRHPTLEPTTRDEIAEDLIGESRELSALVNSLVDLASIADSTEAMLPTSLADIARGAARRLPHEQRERVTVSGDAVALVATSQMQRAVLNLLTNAVKFDASGGRVEVRVEERSDACRLSVRDRGPGFEERDLPEVFARFHRSEAARSTPGSGLGLAIVADIVERHDGRVWAQNAQDADGGAMVCIELARAELTTA